MNSIQTLIKNNNYIRGKINPENIGYLCSNGNINFSTYNAAYNYAKKLVLKALHENIPYERGIIIDGKSIVGNVKGNKNTIIFKNINTTNKTIVHDHPGYSPISDCDASVLLVQNQKACIAINNNGEFSKLSMLPASKLYELLPPVIKKYVSFPKHFFIAWKLRYEFSKFEQKVNSKIQISKIEKEIQKIINSVDNKTNDLLIKLCDDFNNYEYFDISKIPTEYRTLFNKLNEIILFKSKAFRYFWQKNANKYGLKYESNYSNKMGK